MKAENSRKEYIIFGTTVFIGFLAHAFFMFNKISNHDDVDGLADTWDAFQSGRWGLEGINRLTRLLYGSNISVSWLNIFVSILIIAFSSILLVKIFDVESTFICCIIGGTLVTFPSMISAVMYCHSTPHYSFSIFLVILASFLTVKKSGKFYLGASIVLSILSMSIYQAYISICVSILVIDVLFGLKRESAVKKQLLKGIKYIFVLMTSVAGYIVVTKMLVKMLKWPLLSYQNLNSMGAISFNGILVGILQSYKSIYHLCFGNYYGMSGPLIVKIIMCVLCVIVAALTIKDIYDFIINKSISTLILYLFLIIILPIALNTVLFMGAGEIHSVMLYSIVFVPVYCYLLADYNYKNDKILIEFWRKREYRRVFQKYSCFIAVVICAVQLIFAYIHMANVAYTEMELVKNEVQTYMTIMISGIKSVDGYDANKKIVFAGKIQDDSLTDLSDQFSYLKLAGIDTTDRIISMKKNKIYLKYYLGFDQEVIDLNECDVNDVVDTMPCYPADGSIMTLDDIIVVKLSD